MPEGLLKLLKFNSKSLWVWSHNGRGFTAYCTGTCHTGLLHIRMFRKNSSCRASWLYFTFWGYESENHDFSYYSFTYFHLSRYSKGQDQLIPRSLNMEVRLRMNDKVVYQIHHTAGISSMTESFSSKKAYGFEHGLCSFCSRHKRKKKTWVWGVTNLEV